MLVSLPMASTAYLITTTLDITAAHKVVMLLVVITEAVLVCLEVWVVSILT